MVDVDETRAVAPAGRVADCGPAARGRWVVLAPNWLGDAVMALPAIADVKRAYPGVRLIVAARPAVAGMYRLAPAVDEVLELEWRGRPLRRDGWAHDVSALRGAGCEAALLLPNSFAAAWLTRRAGIAERWGYAADLRGRLLTRAVRRPRGSVHQAVYYQRLVRALGIPNGPTEAVIEVPPTLTVAARALLLARGWDGERPLVVMAPGAAYGTAKRWHPSQFARLAAMLGRERGIQCALVGSRADAATTKEVAGLAAGESPEAPIDLAGATTLETLAGVLSLAAACVSNDSGTMHLAAAAGVPVVAIFGPTREHETAPLPRGGRRAEVVTHPVWCRPCMLRTCPINHRCMTRIAPARVFSVVSDLLVETR